MVLVPYIALHLISFLFLDKKFRVVYQLLAIVSFLLIILLKKDTYDIFSYTQAVNYSEVFEPGFHYLISFFKLFSDKSRMIISGVQVFIFLLATGLIFFFRDKRFFKFSLIISSLFLVLAVNNALRQGIATILILYGLVHLLERHFLKTILYFLLAISFHFSSIVFTFLIILVYLFLKSSIESNRFIRSIVFMILGGALSSLLISAVVKLAGYEVYLNTVLTENNERTPLLIKLIPIIAVFLISEFFVGFKFKFKMIDFMRSLRYFLIFLLLPLAFLPGLDELGARILFFYFGLEMLLLLFLVEYRFFQPTFWILLSYTLAFNAWNVLGA